MTSHIGQQMGGVALERTPASARGAGSGPAAPGATAHARPVAQAAERPVLDVAFVARALGVEPIPGPQGLPVAPFSAVSTDTRTIAAGALFVPLAGPRFDGHDFLAEALARGCAAALIHRPPEGPAPVALFPVADTLEALTRLAAAWRAAVDPTVIAITGSSGKTTVREMIAAILARGGGVHATRGNLNNHIGLPLTLLAMPADCRVLVAEMGMSAAGEIAHLAAIARPDIGVVTNIGAAHMASFDGMEGIARAKGELLEALPPDGLGIFPAVPTKAAPAAPFASPPAAANMDSTVSEDDLSHGRLLRALCAGRAAAFGLESDGADGAWADERRPESGGVRFVMRFADGAALPLMLPHPGDHMVADALAAALAARAAGAPDRDIIAALEAFSPPAGRGAARLAPGGWTVLDDAYNANPASVAAALRALERQSAPGARVAILGDMLELGEAADALHAGLAEAVRDGCVDRLLTAGPQMAALHRALADDPAIDCRHQPDPGDWVGGLRALLKPGDVVLVKGSRGMRMERIVQDLLESEN